MIRGWNTAVEGALRSSVGATRAARLALTHGSAFSQSYRSQFEPEDAASDILRLAALSGREERDVRVYRRHDDKPGQLRLKVYRLREIIPLSDAVPVLDRKSVVEGKSVSVRLDLGGRRIITKKNT